VGAVVGGYCRVTSVWQLKRARVDSISEIIPFPHFYFVPFRAGHTKTVQGNMSRSGVCALRGDEYIYCNTLHIPDTTRPPIRCQGHRTDKSVQRRSCPDVSRKKQIRNVFCLFSDSRNGRVEQSMIADVSYCRVENPNVVNKITFTIFLFEINGEKEGCYYDYFLLLQQCLLFLLQ